ncbi:MAG: ABC transporter ATP-binding protein [Oscillospiraceae bacterium]|nr:ABC transporter ATP-binding protein [Oscillospiraceae bacterium]MBQ7341516.1 ABC transporter ATP-binding protein [Oscillospiraceae bacterium]
MPPVKLRGDGRMAANPKKTLFRLLSYLKSYWYILIVVMVCIVINAIAQTTGSVALGKLVDQYILPMVSDGSSDFAPILSFLLEILCIYVVGIVASFLLNFLMAGVTQKTQKTVRDQMFTKMQTLPIRYFDTNAAGNIMSRYTSDVDTLRQMISQSIPQTVSSLVTLAVVLFRMLTTSWILTCVTMVTVLGVVFVTKVLAGKSGKFFVGQQRSLGAVNGYIEEMVNGQKVVKVFNHEQACKEEFDKLNEELCQNAYAAGKFSNMMGPINNNLGYIQYAVLAIFGGILVVSSKGSLLSLGSLMAFMMLSKTFNMPINMISNQINAIVMALAGAERVFELLDQEPEEDHGYVTLVNAHIDAEGNVTESEKPTGQWAWKHPHQADGTVTYTPLRGDITMYNVDFGYVPEKTVLHDVTLYANPGQKLAFVGATGAGKTTITNLINRFYDIADGKIRYDGININKIRKPDLRRSLGMVLQDTNLFTGTVMENIRYGKLDATDEECIKAAKLANAHDFITRLPQGYDTLLTANGASLSQGQRQLIAIARAAVADPPVMILDEATSSIDTRTEALVQKGMDALMKGRTTFVIAHRLSTIMNSDCIMVLDQGRIVERGSHDDLIAQKGIYYRLYTGAFELE